MTEVCNKCGELVSTMGEDALSYCPIDGIVEGNTHEEERYYKLEDSKLNGGYLVECDEDDPERIF